MSHPHALVAAALFAAAVATATPAFAQNSAQTCVQVEVSNVRPQQGQLMVAAYGSAETYQKKPLVALRLPAGEETMRFQLCGLSGNEVALSLFQDLDSDGKMGTNMFGLPLEPWGGSGSPGMMGPSWANGRVALDGKTIAVRLSQ